MTTQDFTDECTIRVSSHSTGIVSVTVTHPDTDFVAVRHGQGKRIIIKEAVAAMQKELGR